MTNWSLVLMHNSRYLRGSTQVLLVQKVPIINCKDKYEKSIKNNIFIIMTF